MQPNEAFQDEVFVVSAKMQPNHMSQKSKNNPFETKSLSQSVQSKNNGPALINLYKLMDHNYFSNESETLKEV